MKNWRRWNLRTFAKVVCVLAALSFANNLLNLFVLGTATDHTHGQDFIIYLLAAYLAYRIHQLEK